MGPKNGSKDAREALKNQYRRSGAEKIAARENLEIEIITFYCPYVLLFNAKSRQNLIFYFSFWDSFYDPFYSVLLTYLATCS